MTELSFAAIRDRMIQGWRTLAVLAAAGMLLAIIMLSFQRPVYDVRMTVMPAPSAQSSLAAGGSSGTLGSLFSLGVGNTSSDYVRYQRLLSSTVVAQRLADKYGMLQYVFHNLWDPQTKTWKEPHTIRTYLLGWLFAIAHVPMWSPPDVPALAKFLEASIQIMPSTQTDIVNLSMNSGDPAFARRVMLLAHQEANEVLRQQVEIRSRQKAAYLRDHLNQINVEDYRQTLLALLSTEEKTLMVTQTTNAYAAEILSPPTASATPVSPRPVMSLFVGALVGLVLGTTLLIFFGPSWWKPVLGRLPSFGGRNRYANSLQNRAAE